MNSPARTDRSFQWPWMALLVFLAGIGVYSLSINRVYDIHEKYIAETISEFGQVPSAGVQASSLEFKGVLADYFLFRTLTYVGLRIGEKKPPSKEEWDIVYHMLNKVTDLDPRFWDPYLFAEMMFAWQGGMVDKANAMLKKATVSRPEDYRPFYYLGFNYLYFEKNPEQAAPYLRKAAELPDAPSFLKGLASRISLYAGQTGIGIFFLETLINETQDPKTVRYLEKRMSALKVIFYLEGKVQEYQKQYGTLPASLQSLVTTGIVPVLPEDPYGGKLILLKDGRVYTTSKLLENKK